MTEETLTIKKGTYQKLLIGLVVVLVALSFTAGFVLGGDGKVTGQVAAVQQVQQVQQPTQQQAQQQPTQPSRVSFQIPDYVGFKGSSSAPLNIIEFGDYQCPFCERFFSQTEPQLLTDYVNTSKAKFYFLDFTFLGPDSITLSDGAWCANDQGKYYDYYAYMYSNQGQENSGWATADKVKTMAANIPGLDTATFNSCLDSKKYESRVNDNTKLGQNAGISGTPAFLIGNSAKGYTLLVGAQPYSTFQQTMDQELTN